LSAEKTEPKAEEKVPKEAEVFVNTALQAVQKQIREQNEYLSQLGQAIVQLGAKIEAGGGKGGGGSPIEKILENISKGVGGGGGSLDDVAKTVEGLVRFSESMDRFRKPSPIGPAEALLMRAGYERIRNPFGRYMTKTEMNRYEQMWKLMGVEGEEGEGGGEHTPEG